MGMYTGLRLKATVKPEYRHIVRGIMDQNNEGKEWHDFVDDHPFLTEYANKGRAMFIPFGGLSYMPDQWDEDVSIQASSFERQFNEETGYWAFNCSLKNYESEIELFFSSVLPILLESSEYIEVLYEEWKRGELYELRNNTIEYVGETTEKYREEDTPTSVDNFYLWQAGLED